MTNLITKIRTALRAELDTIVGDLAGVVEDLERFVDDKALQVADHLEEIALHTRQVDVKRADIARAQRISERLNELLK